MAKLNYKKILILAVQEFPAIYDKAHPQYKERGPGGVVKNTWSENLTNWWPQDMVSKFMVGLFMNKQELTAGKKFFQMLTQILTNYLIAMQKFEY